MLALLFGLAGLFVADFVWHRRASWSKRWLAAGAAAAALLLAIAVAALPGGYRLQKLFAQLLMPAGLLWCAAFAVAVFAWHRRAVAPAIAALSCWLALGIAGNAMLGASMLAALERDYAELDPLDETPFDAVFVLGGGTRLSPEGAPQLGSAGDRVMLAARLHHRGVAPILVTSGSSIPGRPVQRDLSTETLSIWRDLGIDAEVVIRVPEPVNTREEIAAYAELARQRSWQRLGLVTSAWHMRRAMRLAKAHGLDAAPLPADFRGTPRYEGPVSLIPSGGGFAAVEAAAWEWLGAAIGR